MVPHVSELLINERYETRRREAEVSRLARIAVDAGRSDGPARRTKDSPAAGRLPRLTTWVLSRVSIFGRV